jgi:hypothetical protein
MKAFKLLEPPIGLDLLGGPRQWKQIWKSQQRRTVSTGTCLIGPLQVVVLSKGFCGCLGLL